MLRVPISRRAGVVLAVLSIAVPLAAWWIAASAIGNPQVLPTPVAAVRAGVELARSGALLTDTGRRCNGYCSASGWRSRCPSR
jgi:ABC-type nitrate/sulfonate/bicarbonate transport system permease component